MICLRPTHEQVVRRSGFTTHSDPRLKLTVGWSWSALDRYLWGDVERISPEAPVPVVRVTRSSERLGGSANVAASLVGLGVDVVLAGNVGADADGLRIEELLSEVGIKSALTRSDDRATITKTRVLGGHQQMLRLPSSSHISISP